MRSRDYIYLYSQWISRSTHLFHQQLSTTLVFLFISPNLLSLPQIWGYSKWLHSSTWSEVSGWLTIRLAIHVMNYRPTPQFFWVHQCRYIMYNIKILYLGLPCIKCGRMPNGLLRSLPSDEPQQHSGPTKAGCGLWL